MFGKGRLTYPYPYSSTRFQHISFRKVEDRHTRTLTVLYYTSEERTYRLPVPSCSEKRDIHTRTPMSIAIECSESRDIQTLTVGKGFMLSETSPFGRLRDAVRSAPPSLVFPVALRAFHSIVPACLGALVFIACRSRRCRVSRGCCRCRCCRVGLLGSGLARGGRVGPVFPGIWFRSFPIRGVEGGGVVEER